MKKYFVFLGLIIIFLLMLLNCPVQTKDKDDDKSSSGSSEYNIIKTIDSTGIVGGYNSIAVSGTNVYISYYDWTNDNLKFAKSTDGGTNWTTQIVDDVGIVGGYPSIAVFKPIIPGPDYVYISYYDYTNRNLKFAKSTDSGDTWPIGNIKEVDSADDVGGYNSIAVSGLGGKNVYISYFDDANDDLKFAKSVDNGNTWPAGNIKTVELTGQVGWFTSIAVSSSNIYISYNDGTNGNLKFAKSTDGGTNWTTQIVDDVGTVGWYTSIAVSSSNIYISYLDATNGNLKFAKSTNRGTNWTTQTVDSGGNVGWYTSIAVSGNYVYISYFDITNQDLKFAKSVNGGTTW